MANHAIPVPPGYRVTPNERAAEEFHEAAGGSGLHVIALMSHDPGGALPVTHYLVVGGGLAHPRWLEGRAVASFEAPRPGAGP